MAQYNIERIEADDYLPIGSTSKFPSELGVASLCSGSGTGELAINHTVEGMAEHYSFPCATYVPFMAEKEPWKQKWLMENGFVGKDTCLFDDCTKIMDNDAFCVNHKKKCNILNCRRTHILKSGFSCKSWSRANVNFKENRNGMAGMKNELTSVKTFNSTRDVIVATKPDIFVFENVESIGDTKDDDSNLSIVVDTLGSIDDEAYLVHVIHIVATDFFIPQTRQGFIMFPGQLVQSCAL